ncbi:hypothetical protein [Ottowia sp.]|uniref:hypothetical protein n=1 Tax=Ottowia sp. TaxID=1898956 RepID=UPI0025E34464|nr:hypothetical protein [Ottowia sp.]MBK6748124.1 hypothetical protein [Ottowia sp.]
MTTVTLIQAAAHDVQKILTMTAQPMNVVLTNITGGAIQFQCSNPKNTISGAKTVDIIYDANVRGNPHQTIQVSSVIAFAAVAIEQPGSDLDPMLPDVPWASSYAEGVGVDAITGNTMGVSALVPFQTIPAKIHNSTEKFDVIASFDSMNHKIETSTKGEYNIEGVSIDESIKYLTDIRQSALEITYIVECKVQDAVFEASPKSGYVLTDEAKNIMRNDPDKFRATYGDYFVASKQNASSFQAIYNLKAKSSNELKSFEASAGVSVEGLFSKNGSAKFENDAAHFGIQISSRVYMIGVDDVKSQPIVSTPTDVPDALKWFKEHQVGVPQRAKLIHYNSLHPGYPRRVNVSTEEFTELRELYTQLWEVRVLYNSLPDFYSQQLGNYFIDVDSGISSNQSKLATDGKMRASFQSKANDLVAQMKKIRSRQDFYDALIGMAHSEPTHGSKISESSTSNVWEFGHTASEDPESIKLYVSTVNARDDAPGCGYRSRNIAFGPDPKHMIVGWEVISNWHDGSNGFWKKATEKIISTNYGAIYVEGKFDRGFNWTVKYYYVDAEPYSHFD